MKKNKYLMMMHSLRCVVTNADLFSHKAVQSLIVIMYFSPFLSRQQLTACKRFLFLAFRQRTDHKFLLIRATPHIIEKLKNKLSEIDEDVFFLPLKFNNFCILILTCKHAKGKFNEMMPTGLNK